MSKFRWLNPAKNDYVQGLSLVAISTGAWFLDPVFGSGVVVGMIVVLAYVLLVEIGILK